MTLQLNATPIIDVLDDDVELALDIFTADYEDDPWNIEQTAALLQLENGIAVRLNELDKCYFLQNWEDLEFETELPFEEVCITNVGIQILNNEDANASISWCSLEEDGADGIIHMPLVYECNVAK